MQFSLYFFLKTRFRGHEDCGSQQCPFRPQKTTHFHCNRSGCGFNFKNKADMEKHKNYHMKDEQLLKDGFKKFVKSDECGFDGCRFSKTVNHIHCVRPGCDYVLHSSGQLYSHKRRHDRRDSEEAYRKFKLAQGILDANGHGDAVAGLGGVAAGGDPMRPPSSGSPSSEASSTPPLCRQDSSQGAASSSSSSPGLRGSFMIFGSSPSSSASSQPLLISEQLGTRVPDDIWREYLLHFDTGEGCGFQVRQRRTDMKRDCWGTLYARTHEFEHVSTY